MAMYQIRGQSALRGQVVVTGSPVAAAGLIAAAILSTEKTTLTNIPHLQDIDLLMQELRACQVAIDWTDEHEITIDPQQVSWPDSDSSQTLSGWPLSLLAALVVRTRQGAVPVALTQNRPDLSSLLQLLGRFGAEINTDHPQKMQLSLNHLHAAEVDISQAGSDQTLVSLLLATTAEGTSVIDGAVVTPEVQNIIECLQSQGAIIERLDEARFSVQGQPQLKGVAHRLIGDRYQMAFWAIAAIMTAGDVVVSGVKPTLITPFLAKLQQAGLNYTVNSNNVRIWRDKRADPPRPLNLTSRPFPGLNDDWLALLAPVAALPEEPSSIKADSHQLISDLQAAISQFGLTTQVESDALIITPISQLEPASVTSRHFLVAMSSLLLSLAAPGQSEIGQAELLDGRFEDLVETCNKLGAKISRQE